MIPTWEIKHGHAVDILRSMPSESVHMVMTSPPYWGLRKYGANPQVWGGDPECEHLWEEGEWKRRLGDDDKGEWKEASNKGSHNRDAPIYFASCSWCDAWRGHLGLEPTPELYIRNMVAVFAELWRVLRTDGSVWLNMGETWWGGKGMSNMAWDQTNHDRATLQKPYQTIGGTSEIRPQDRPHPVIKPKDVVGIPWMLAFALREWGWWLRSPLVWHKPNPMPGSYKNRPTNAHEYVFILTKSGNTTFFTHRTVRGARIPPEPDYLWRNIKTGEELNSPPVAWHPKRSCSIGRIGCGMCNIWKRVNKWEGHDYYYDAESTATDPSEESKAQYGRNSSYDGNGQKPYAMKNRPSGAKANLRSVWTIPTQSYHAEHFAAYPEKLVEPCVLMGTSERGVCAECGAPFSRIIDVKYVNPGNRTTNGPRNMDRRHESPGFPTRLEKVTNTIGWQPTCEHDSEPVPAVVLDPFSGTATTGVVALRLGRAYIGIDLSEQYVEIGRRRIIEDAPLMNAQGEVHGTDSRGPVSRHQRG